MSRKNLRLTERDFKEGNLVQKNEGRKGAEDGVAGVGGQVWVWGWDFGGKHHHLLKSGTWSWQRLIEEMIS